MASVSCAMASVFAKSINGRSDTKIKNALKSKNFLRIQLNSLEEKNAFSSSKARIVCLCKGQSGKRDSLVGSSVKKPYQ